MSQAKISSLDDFARIRLSKTFFMRDFLFSETAAILGMNNIPTDKNLAVKAGTALCQNVLEPIQDVWGRIHVRSAFRSEQVNQAGNDLGANCATNESNYAGHIWDKEDADGYGATACIVIPAYVDYYEQTGDWQSLAWWVHHHIPAYQKMTFFKNLCAFNIRWHSNPEKVKEIKTSTKDAHTGKKTLLTNGEPNDFYKAMTPAQRFQKCIHLINK